MRTLGVAWGRAEARRSTSEGWHANGKVGMDLNKMTQTSILPGAGLRPTQDYNSAGGDLRLRRTFPQRHDRQHSAARAAHEPVSAARGSRFPDFLMPRHPQIPATAFG